MRNEALREKRSRVLYSDQRPRVRHKVVHSLTWTPRRRFGPREDIERTHGPCSCLRFTASIALQPEIGAAVAETGVGAVNGDGGRVWRRADCSESCLGSAVYFL